MSVRANDMAKCVATAIKTNSGRSGRSRNVVLSISCDPDLEVGWAFRNGELFRRKGRVRDRHGRSGEVAQSDNLRVKLLRQRVDDAGAKADFRLSKDPVRFSNPVVGNRELPVRSGSLE